MNTNHLIEAVERLIAANRAWQDGEQAPDVVQAFEELEKVLKDVKQEKEEEDNSDICGLCDLPGADKIAHPVHWPGERVSDTGFVHNMCEDLECKRAFLALSEEERKSFLRSL
jgi:hypothetical protein